MKLTGVFTDNTYQRVLLVDEECGSGETLAVARKAVQDCAPGVEIREAVIAVCKEGYIPDYYNFKCEPINRFIGRKSRFPWIPYSPYYQEYTEWLLDNVD